MIQVNLLPWREQQTQRWCRRWCGGLLLQLVLAMLMVCAVREGVAQQHAGEVLCQQRLQAQSARLQAHLTFYHTRQQKQQAVLDTLVRATALRSQSQQRRARLAQLAWWIPEQTWLVRARDDQCLYLEGHSTDYISIVLLLDQLKQHPKLKNVELESAMMGMPERLLRFSLSACWQQDAGYVARR